MSSSSPTARMRPSLTATASAAGCASFMVEDRAAEEDAVSDLLRDGRRSGKDHRRGREKGGNTPDQDMSTELADCRRLSFLCWIALPARDGSRGKKVAPVGVMWERPRSGRRQRPRRARSAGRRRRRTRRRRRCSLPNGIHGRPPIRVPRSDGRAGRAGRKGRGRRLARVPVGATGCRRPSSTVPQTPISARSAGATS